MYQDRLIREIVEREWRMFGRVRNIGQRAACQDDHPTFYIMRVSQLSTWTVDVLESYQSDLQAAEKQGVNLLERKYAYMMGCTDPDYYARALKPHLPEISRERERLAQRIAAVYTAWHCQTAARFPHFAGHGRPASVDATSGGTVPADIYLLGELLSYSEETCVRMHVMLRDALTAGRNLVEENYEHIARMYGYSSLSEAEAALARKENGLHG